jgi:CDP-diacylglycerol--glycerol-3-phosphate 3-phosphatidyltransferase
MIDGAIARKTGAVSNFGAKLDTVADFVFMAICVVKLLPRINISIWLWIWVSVIAMIKFINIVWGFLRRKEFVAYHTVLNKITGLLLFFLPFTLQFIEPIYSFAVVCIIATIAAIQEGYYHIKKNDE